MNLTLRQLETFREVMHSCSISQAARTLNRTQPAISSMIAGLEQQLGFALFIRKHSRLTPTPESYFFLEEIEDVLNRLEQSQRTVQEIANLERGRLRIACHPAASSFFMPNVVSKFASKRPGLNISLMMRSSLVVDDLIASQKFDVGLAEKPQYRHTVKTIDFDLECLCALRKDDPLVKHKIITPELLDGCSLATLYDSHHTYRQTNQCFERSGKIFNRRFELQTFLPALELVEFGLCYCICDMVTAFGYIQHRGCSTEIIFRPFRPITISTISLLTPTHRPQSQLAQAFCSLLVTEIEKMEAAMIKL